MLLYETFLWEREERKQQHCYFLLEKTGETLLVHLVFVTPKKENNTRCKLSNKENEYQTETQEKEQGKY